MPVFSSAPSSPFSPPLAFRIHCVQAHSALCILHNSSKDLLYGSAYEPFSSSPLIKTSCPMSQNLSGSRQFDMLFLKVSSMNALINNNGITSSENICFQIAAFNTLIQNSGTLAKTEEEVLRDKGAFGFSVHIFQSLLSFMTDFTHIFN